MRSPGSLSSVEVEKALVGFYRFLHGREFSTEHAILTGSAALALRNIEERAADIDILIVRRKEFAHLQRLLNPGKKTCPFPYRWRAIGFQIGLPHDFPGLVRPFDAKEKMKMREMIVNVRPLTLIASDYSNYLSGLEAECRRINEPLSVLEESVPTYVKYKRRLEKLRSALSLKPFNFE